MLDDHDTWARFVVIDYDVNDRQFVFSAARWNSTISSHICQLQKQGLLLIIIDNKLRSKHWATFTALRDNSGHNP